MLSYKQLNPVSTIKIPSAESTPSTHNANEEKQLPPFIFAREIDNIASSYVDPVELTTNGIYSSTNPSTFFEGQVFGLYLTKLLQHAVHGEKDQVDDMLKNNPLLLLERGTVTDYSGRTHFNRTVYQLALGATDCDVINEHGLKVVDGMIEMIEEHFKKLTNKTPEEREQLKKSQYDDQFPADEKEQEATRIKNDSFALNTVISVIASASDEDCKNTNSIDTEVFMISRDNTHKQKNEVSEIVQAVIKAKTDKSFEDAFEKMETYIRENKWWSDKPSHFSILKAIYKFRNYLEPKGVITSGKHFNYKLFSEAVALYSEKSLNFNRSKHKEDISFQKVIGYIERFLPACDAQVIAQAVWDISELSDKKPRSLAFSHGGRAYYPFAVNDFVELGYGYGAVAQIWLSFTAASGWDRQGALQKSYSGTFSDSFKKYIEYKATRGNIDLGYVHTVNPKKASM
jgi:hypothetical protein